MDNSIAIYFQLIAAVLIVGGIVYMMAHYDSVSKAPGQTEKPQKKGK